ncbi:MAG: group II intron reverse transcriptase domain-containing protein [Candidatus Pacebacteria bacterium]|nr:group II intron reverse transcriptase domain-containing protein [Candidatus Paceibacterota bacterium]
MSNLLLSWREFLAGKRKRKDVEEFSVNLTDNILSLHQDLKNKTYIHAGYHAFNISDPKPRNIHKATVRDRLLHHAIYRILYPHFDKKFIFDSYSCRVDKGTHKAINRFRTFSRMVSKNNTKTCFILKCDIRKFFANIDHQILKSILSRGILDIDTLWLLGQVIDSFQPNHIYAIADIRKGLPLGNLTSQLLVNIYMNEFDQYMKRELKVKYYIRYADDFVILSENKKYLEDLLQYIVVFLEEKLKLQLHPDKVFIKTFTSGVDFLGWVHFSRHRVLRTATKRRMLKNLKWNPSEESKKSYLGMLSHGNGYKLGMILKP